VSTSPAADVIVAVCSVGSAALGFAASTRAAGRQRREKHAGRHAADGTPASGPPVAALPPPSPVLDPAAVLLEAAGPGASRTLRATGTVDLTVTITQPMEGQPRMPGKRYALRPDPGDGRMLPDEATEEPAEQDQVLNEEETPGDYAGDPEEEA
jgi:hypothetical protein